MIFAFLELACLRACLLAVLIDCSFACFGCLLVCVLACVLACLPDLRRRFPSEMGSFLEKDHSISLHNHFP